MEGQDCLQGVPQTYAAALSRGEESGASQPAQGLFTDNDVLFLLIGLSELPDQREQQKDRHVGDDHAGSRGDGQSEGRA